MAKKDPASKRQLAVARAYARYTLNLQRAFGDLVPKLKRAYGQPARHDAEARTQHVAALLAIAHFLKHVGPEPDGDLAHFADQFAKLAQALQDRNEGRRVPILNPPAIASRSDETLILLARAHVALAVETMRWVIDPMRGAGYTRESAAEWAANRYPGLERLITESGPALERSKSLKTAIISWCERFSSRKVKNPYAAHAYSVGLDRLKAWAPNRNSDQKEAEADKLLQQAHEEAAAL
jgi:hypothetical protein